MSLLHRKKKLKNMPNILKVLISISLAVLILGCLGNHYEVINRSTGEKLSGIPSWQMEWTSDLSDINTIVFGLFTNEEDMISNLIEYRQDYVSEVEQILKSEYNFPNYLNTLNRGKIIARISIVELKKMNKKGILTSGASSNRQPSSSETDQRWQRRLIQEWNKGQTRIKSKIGVDEIALDFYDLEMNLIGHFEMKSTSGPILPRDVAREISKLFDKEIYNSSFR